MGFALLSSTVSSTAAMAAVDDEGFYPCPEVKPQFCLEQVNRFCATIFFYRESAEIDEAGISSLLDMIAENAEIRKPQSIEITPYFMDGVGSESEELSKKRAENVAGALMKRGVQGKLLKQKPVIEGCVARDRQIEQRRVELVFVQGTKKNE
jgi:outer membrane protein OmpA-like peptidoglycan-associated protein